MNLLQRIFRDLHQIPHELSQITSIKRRAARNDFPERRSIPRLPFLKALFTAEIFRQVRGVVVMAAGHDGNLSYGCMVLQLT